VQADTGYLMTASVARSVLVGQQGPEPVQIAWLAVLLASMCGFALLIGRQFAGGRSAACTRRRA
jgi:hypothetical protein